MGNFQVIFKVKQEAVKASNSPRDGKDGILMAKKIFEWRPLFSNDDIFLGRKSGVKFFNDLPTEQKKITVDKVTIMECDPESTSALGKVGEVVEVPLPDIVMVFFDKMRGWAFSAAALTKESSGFANDPTIGEAFSFRDEATGDIPTVPQSQQLPKEQMFSVGDKVVMAVDVETAEKLQDGHGGWNDSMEDVIGKIGRVEKIHPTGNVVVHYDKSLTDDAPRHIRMFAKLIEEEWAFNPLCLRKVQSFSVGDKARVFENKAVVEKMQQEHGKWIGNMRKCLPYRTSLALSFNVGKQSCPQCKTKKFIQRCLQST